MKVNFLPMKSKKFSLVLPLKKLIKSVKPQERSKSKTSLAIWMVRWKTFHTNGLKKVIPMLSYMLERKKKKAMKVATKNLLLKKVDQMLFNGLACCRKLRLSNSPFVMAKPEISEIMQLPKMSSMHISTMLTLTKSSDSLLHTLVRQGIKHSQQLKRKVQHVFGMHSHWNP